MNQTTFEFAKDPFVEQLELFSEESYDNRVKRLSYALRISYDLNGWRPYKLDNVSKCVRMFKVSHEQVWREWEKVIGNEKNC